MGKKLKAMAEITDYKSFQKAIFDLVSKFLKAIAPLAYPLGIWCICRFISTFFWIPEDPFSFYFWTVILAVATVFLAGNDGFSLAEIILCLFCIGIIFGLKPEQASTNISEKKFNIALEILLQQNAPKGETVKEYLDRKEKTIKEIEDAALGRKPKEEEKLEDPFKELKE
jgi:hypothetical protein